MFCAVASPDYQDAHPAGPDPPGAVAGVAEYTEERIDYDRLHHTWVEVIEPAEGGVVARLLFPGSVLSVLPGARVAVRSVADSGDPLVLIYRFELNAPG